MHEIFREIDMCKIERLRLRYIYILMIAFIKCHPRRLRGGHWVRKNGGKSSIPGALSPVLENFLRRYFPDPTDRSWVSGNGLGVPAGDLLREEFSVFL